MNYPQDIYQITQDPIETAKFSCREISGLSGATVIFLGTVRNSTDGEQVLYLFYEIYSEMVLKEMKSIGKEVRARWDINQVSIVHRYGRVEVGEISVLISVSSPHRDDAYGASKFIIEGLKRSVPIWKKEVCTSGEKWIQGS